MIGDKKALARALAKHLAGPNAVRMSMGLQLGHEGARALAEIRSATPLFGHQSVEEAEAVLLEWLERKEPR